MTKGRLKKKIENFGDFVLKGGRGSFQKPNFFIDTLNLGHFRQERGGSKPEFINSFVIFIKKIPTKFCHIF